MFSKGIRNQNRNQIPKVAMGNSLKFLDISWSPVNLTDKHEKHLLKEK